MAARGARASVEEMCCSVQRIRPERRRHGGVYEHRANTVIESAQDALGAAILLRGVWAGETKDDAMSSEKGAKRLVVELLAIVLLERKNGATELSLHERMEANECWQHIGFVFERKRPDVVGVVVKHHKVELATRVAEDRRGPDITVQETERIWRNM